MKKAGGKKRAAGGKKKSSGGKKKAGGAKKGGKKKGGKKKGTAKDKKKTPAPIPDPMSYEAMLNAYYIAHGPVQFLQFRGYNWSGSASKKKTGKGGKKKKK